MYIKLMSGENIPDSDNRKAFTIIENVRRATMHRHPHGKAVLLYWARSSTEMMDVPFEASLDLEGNAYLMSDTGKTIATFGVAPYMPTDDAFTKTIELPPIRPSIPQSPSSDNG